MQLQTRGCYVTVTFITLIVRSLSVSPPPPHTHTHSPIRNSGWTPDPNRHVVSNYLSHGAHHSKVYLGRGLIRRGSPR
jgi:hypothetical protein